MPNKENGPSPVDIREDNLLALSSAMLDTHDYHSLTCHIFIVGEWGMVIWPCALKANNRIN